jgi:hypothetical protein
MELAWIRNACMLRPCILLDTKVKYQSCWQGELHALNFNALISVCPCIKVAYAIIHDTHLQLTSSYATTRIGMVLVS